MREQQQGAVRRATSGAPTGTVGHERGAGLGGAGWGTRWVRRTGVLAVAAGLVLLWAPEASAGGPTSVLITSPSSREAVALPVSDARYVSLEKLLGPSGTGSRAQPASLDGSAGTRQINVTWMALDLRPARTDRVFPGEDPDTVWIHTATEVPDTYRGRWHRAAEPRRLTALLQQLGLMGRPSVEGGGPVLFPEPWESKGLFGRGADRSPAAAWPAVGPASASAPAVPSSASAQEQSASGSHMRLDRWWWAIPGLVAGSALTWAALRRGAGVRVRGQRQQLLDG
ncbi:hypothetical protein ACFRH6_09460 [Streptomyces sp. NPDC056749]|uniref:hypothetical protein n=1 Tax=Streptomyces sp. NPDC056749 TaxID=3345936 RepID=UPI00369DA284